MRQTDLPPPPTPSRSRRAGPLPAVLALIGAVAVLTGAVALVRDGGAVRTVDASGETSSGLRKIVSIPEPEPEAARVEGIFTVRLDERAHHGFRGLVPERTAQFIFEPRCPKGPCATRWTYVDHPGVISTARRSGDAYAATADGRLDVPCGARIPVTTLTLRFRVTRAALIGGEWVPERLEGTLTEHTPPQFGCVASDVRYAFTATPLPPQAVNVFRVINETCRFDGTAFLTSSGYVVTNAHVVAGTTSPTIELNGRAVTATVVGFSTMSDLAVLDVGPIDHEGFELSSRDGILGPFMAFGFPNGRSLSRIDVRLTRTVRNGFSLSGEPAPVRGYALRGDIRHGDSGGPIISGANVVLGVITSGIAGKGGYAVSATEVARLIRTVDPSTPVSTGDCYRG